MSLNTAEIINIESLIDYQKKSVVSTEIIKKETGNVTLFAFDENEGLSEHSAPFDALVQVVDGSLTITIDKVEHSLNKGEIIIMPANIPHALHANTKVKMILTMIKSQ